jgi:TolA-binding protein
MVFAHTHTHTHTYIARRAKPWALAVLLYAATALAAHASALGGRQASGQADLASTEVQAPVQAQLAQLQVIQAQQQRTLDQQLAVMRELRDMLASQWQSQAQQNALNRQQADINDRLSREQIKQSAQLLALKAELAALRQRLEAQPPAQPGAVRPEVF